jgi:hypothetical protein
VNPPAQVPVPADIDIADKVLFGLTVRQLLILAPSGLAAALIWQSLGPLVPMEAALVAACLPVAVCAALAIARVDGIGLDGLIAAAIIMPRRPLAAGRGMAASLRLERSSDAQPGAGVLTGPVRTVTEDGLIDLGGVGCARAIDVGSVNFDLLGVSDQSSLVAALARLCYGCEAHLQIVIATRPVDLSGYLDDLERNAASAANPAVGAAARSHTGWLAGLVRTQQLLDRQITVVVTASNEENLDQAAATVLDFAAAIGAEAAVLDRTAIAERVRAGVDPFGTPGRRVA